MDTRWEPIYRLLAEGRQQGVYIAGVALVGFKGELLWEGAVGRLSREQQAPAVTAKTVFDLASLTKPLATALTVMLLQGRGQLALNTTLREILPKEWLPTDKRPLTILSLLAHRAGLPAWRPFYQEVLAAPPAERPTLLVRLAAATALEYPPDQDTLYSDLGYMLLKEAVEAVAGEDLDGFCRKEIYRPLNLKTLGFNPRHQTGSGRLSFAATEEGLIPGRNIPGEVHDENAWAAGGVAGHAGLFGTGREVFELLAALYRTYHGEGVGPFSPDSVRLFLTPVTGSNRTLGFDTLSADAGQCSAGRYFSPMSVGHLGFTGTSFWLDLEQGQMVVLLTNRVHLGRDNLDKIKTFRPRFHEAASRALGFTKEFRK
ncbi:MAG: serine hydrolase domain-containing protein [Desulfobaccales bacterium]|nr:serine hydrolase domain-containing protein [Desulfobaccales bacterium]